MSIRFVEKNLFDVHNTGMTDRHQAPSYPLRMPPELKERVANAAKASGRSMHAEVVARLQQSFAQAADIDVRVGRLEVLLCDLIDKMENNSQNTL